MSEVSRDTTDGEELNPDEQLADDLSQFYADPLGYVMYAFPWDTDPTVQLVKLPEAYRGRFDSVYGPDEWACEFLDDLGAEIEDRGFDGQTAVDPIQFATASGHGIGKSTLAAWLIKFIMDTRPFAKGVVTSNTAEQLRTKTWAEAGKWHKLSLTSHWFDYNTGRGAMSLVHKDHKETWRVDAQTCREENSEAFAGLHAANSTPFYLFDEASNISNKIFEVREGGTTDGEPMTFDFGNPTRNSGRFFENCIGKFKHRYRVRKIDSRDVAITNKARLQAWVDDYGEESDFCKVRVRGDFPSAGSQQFIPTEIVTQAMEREAPGVDLLSPLIIGVDVARFGDDETVIYPRVGMDARSWAPTPGNGRYRGLDAVQVAAKVIEVVKRFKTIGKSTSAIFVDETGVGGGVIDILRHLGYATIGISFGGKPTDTITYRFKVDEMWGELKDALKTSLAIPGMHSKGGVDLNNQLTQREYAYTLLGNKTSLESKRDMKARLGGEFASPDIADALALTFAQDVALAVDPQLAKLQQAPMQAQSEYDPLEQEW